MKVCNVFMIDDDDFFLKSMSNKLAEIKEINIYSFESVEKALDSMKIINPEIVFLDHELKGVNGVDALPLLKSYHPKTEIAIVSGQKNPALCDEAIKKGAIQYIQKDALMMLNLKEIIHQIEPNRGENKKFWENFINLFSNSMPNLK